MKTPIQLPFLTALNATRRAGKFSLAALCLLLGFSGSALADGTWNGGGTGASANWSDNANWGGSAPSYGTLNFPNNTKTTTTNDTFTSENKLLWTGTNAWTLYNAGGTVLSLFDNGGTQAKVENQSTNLVTINAPITFAANNGSPPNPFGEINAVNGNLLFTNATLTVNGSSVNGIKMFGTGRTTTFSNTVSASGKWFGLTATTNTATIGGAFTSGDFYLMNAGTLNLNSSGSFTTTALRLGGDFGNTGNQDQTKGGTFNLTGVTGGQTFSGIINSVSGNTSGALVVNSANTSGVNTLSGGIFLDSGLRFTNAAGGTLQLTGGTDVKAQQIIFGPSGTITVGGLLTNSLAAGGTLLLNGPGTLLLTNVNNSYTGTGTGSLNANGTQISGGGTLGIWGDGSLGLVPAGAYNNIQFTGSGTLQDTTNNITLNANRSISIATGATATLDSSTNTFTVNGLISGLGAVTKIGTGTLTFSNANTYSGGTTLNAGTININNATAIGTGTFTAGGNGFFDNTSGAAITLANNNALTMSGGSPTFNGTSNLNFGTGTVTVSGANRTLTVNSNTLTLGGGVTDAGGTRKLTKAGAGTLVLNGAAGTWTGGSSLDAGTLTVGTDTTLGTGGLALNGGTLTAGNGTRTLANSATLTASSTIGGANNLTLNGVFTNSGGSRTLTVLNTGTTTLGGSVFLSDDNTTTGRALTITNIAPVIISGSISNNNAGNTVAANFFKSGTGALTLSGANTYTGGTTVSGGTLQIGAGGTSGSVASAAITNNGALVFNRSDIITNSAVISGSGTLTNAGAGTLTLTGANTLTNVITISAGTLQIGAGAAAGSVASSLFVDNGALTFSRSDIITNNAVISGTGSLTNAGTGVLILTANNPYSGPTRIIAGELIGVTGGSCSNSAVGVAAGATNGVQITSANGQWVCSGLTYSAGTTYADFNFNGVAPSTSTAPLKVNGNLAFTGTPNIIVRSTNALIAVGQYPLIIYTNALSGTPPATALSLPAGVTATIFNNTANKSIDLVVTVGNTVSWAVGNGVWDINTTANWTNKVSGPLVNYLDGEAVVLDDTASGASPITVFVAATVTPASLTFSNVTKTYTLTSNGIAGAIPLTKLGAGALNLNTNNTFTGGINIGGGAVTLNAATAAGAGLITLSNGATLGVNNFSSSANLTVANALNVAAGASATNTAINLGSGVNGNVTSGDSASILTIPSSTTFGGTLTGFSGTLVAAGGTTRFSNGANGATTLGSATANFIVNSTAPGLQPRNNNTTVNLGSLSGSGTLGSAQTAAGVSPTTTTYSIGALNTSTTFSGKFVEGLPTTNCAVTKIGTGTFTVSGNSPHTAATTVNAGALVGVTGGSFSNSPVTVNTGATNGVSVTIAGGQWTCTNLTYAAAGTEYALFAFGANTPSTTVAPLQVLNNLTISGTLNIIITGSSLTFPVSTTPYPLISYTGTLSGTPPAVPLSLPLYVSGIITNDTANKLISLIVTNVATPPALVWSAGTGTWDFSSLNWTNLGGGPLVAWADTNAALLNDTASGAGPFTVTLTTSVAPIGVTFSNLTKDYTLTGSAGITGTTPLTKAGTGTLTIANSNSFVGLTTISGGTLSLGAGGTAGTLANLAIVDNGALVINHSDAVALASVISGTGSLTNAGGGTTTISVTNTYAGNTTVKSGTLQMTDSGNLAPASTLVLSGGQFTRASQSFTPVKSNAYKFGLAVTADSTVATTATTTRTVHFDSTNITAVPGTTLLVTNAAATGTNHFKFYANGFTYAGNLILGGNGANNMTFLESYNTNDTLPDQIFSGVISGPGRLYKNIEGSSPGGNLIISNAANTFAGGTELRAGYIGLGADSPLGTNRVTFGFDFNPLGFYAVDAPRTLANDIYADVNSSSASTAAGCTNLYIKGSQNLTLSGRILIHTSVQFFIISNSALTTFSGVITNAAANSLGIAKLGSGTLVLAGNNTYSGDTRANVGVLRLGAANVIPDGAGKGNVAVADTLDLNTFSETINGLSGAGSIDTVAGGSPLLTVGNNNATSSFGGVIKNTAGSLALTKTGSGILTLTGANTFTGTTTVGAGTLALSGASVTLASANIAVSSNALFDVSGVTGSFTLGAAQTLSGFGSVNGTLTNNGTIAPGASIGTLTLSNTPVLNGTVVMELNRTNAQNADKLTLTVGTLNYGGALVVTNIGDALTNGDTFVVFAAPGYSGAFTNIVLPALHPSLAWNTNNLAVNGSLSVVLGILPTTLTLTSSSNPSGYLDPLTFTATLAPTNATGSVTFFNGATPFSTNAMTLGVATSASISTLARGTNPITAAYLGDVNYYGSTNSLAQVVTNHAPVVPNVGYYRGAIASYKIKISELLTNSTDADGDTLAASFGTSTNGITLIVGGGFALYYNTNLVNDQLTYTVSDAFGGSNSASITITSAPFLNGQNATVTVSGPTATVSFAGIPGYNYGIQRSTNLTTWAAIWTTNAPAGGLFDFTDDFNDLGVVPASAYYRLQWNP